MHYYGNSRADVSRKAAEVHKPGAGGAHRIGAALAGNPPHPIYVDADSLDIEARGEHVEQVLAAVHVYLTAILSDTASNIPGGGLDCKYLDGLYSDFTQEAVGGIRNAAEESAEHETWRAS